MRRFYFHHHVLPIDGRPGIRSIAVAERAFALLSDYITRHRKQVYGADAGAPRVGDFGLAMQEDFMRWCASDHSLSCKSIAIYMASIKAGFRFAAKPRLVTDGRGKRREVKILASAPHVECGEAHISKVTNLPRSKPRDWIPSDAQLAAFICSCNHEHVFRYVILQLNTWARPEAIFQLSVRKQVDFARRLVDMNPTGRVQNNKVRPMIALSRTLEGWLRFWNLDQPIVFQGDPVRDISNRTLEKISTAAGIERAISSYTLRHYMATRIRRVAGFPVSREQRAEWMGHVDPNHRTTEAWYESLDPDHLVPVADAIDEVMRILGRIGPKSLISPETRPNENVTRLK